MRSERIGFLLYAMALEPTCLAPKGSSISFKLANKRMSPPVPTKKNIHGQWLVVSVGLFLHAGQLYTTEKQKKEKKQKKHTNTRTQFVRRLCNL